MRAHLAWLISYARPCQKLTAAFTQRRVLVGQLAASASLTHQQQRHHNHRPRLCGPHSSMATAAATSTTKVNFSAGSDESALTQTLQRDLLAPAAGEGRGRWRLTESGEGLERSFKFKTFAKTWDFMTAVSLQCKIRNHHPEWSNVYNTTFVRWTTHNPNGLSTKDVELAVICDSLAKDFDEVIEEGGDNCEFRRLADTVTTNAGDCCRPKK